MLYRLLIVLLLLASCSKKKSKPNNQRGGSRGRSGSGNSSQRSNKKINEDYNDLVERLQKKNNDLSTEIKKYNESELKENKTKLTELLNALIEQTEEQIKNGKEESDKLIQEATVTLDGTVEFNKEIDEMQEQLDELHERREQLKLSKTITLKPFQGELDAKLRFPELRRRGITIARKDLAEHYKNDILKGNIPNLDINTLRSYGVRTNMYLKPLKTLKKRIKTLTTKTGKEKEARELSALETKLKSKLEVQEKYIKEGRHRSDFDNYAKLRFEVIDLESEIKDRKANSDLNELRRVYMLIKEEYELLLNKGQSLESLLPKLG